MGRWEGLGPPWEAQEGLQGQVEPAVGSEYLSGRLGHRAQRGRFLLGPAPVKPQGLDGNHREDAVMVAAGCPQEWEP